MVKRLFQRRLHTDKYQILEPAASRHLHQVAFVLLFGFYLLFRANVKNGEQQKVKILQSVSPDNEVSGIT